MHLKLDEWRSMNGRIEEQTGQLFARFENRIKLYFQISRKTLLSMIIYQLLILTCNLFYNFSLFFLILQIDVTWSHYQTERDIENVIIIRSKDNPIKIW